MAPIHTTRPLDLPPPSLKYGYLRARAVVAGGVRVFEQTRELAPMAAVASLMTWGG